MGDEVLRSDHILRRKRTGLLVIDIQEKILKVIHESERVIENSLKLIKGFNKLNLPIYYSEQYPIGLGYTEKRIAAEIGHPKSLEKMSFSCGGAKGFFQSLKEAEIKNLVLCGIEAHVCVTQTALDLLANGFTVHVAADAISSRRESDYMFAVDRMRAAGVETTLSESVLFEMLNECGTDEFRAISKIVK